MKVCQIQENSRRSSGGRGRAGRLLRVLQKHKTPLRAGKRNAFGSASRQGGRLIAEGYQVIGKQYWTGLYLWTYKDGACQS
jgi:hypothetical protein